MSTPAAAFRAQVLAELVALRARVEALEAGRGLWTLPARHLRRTLALSTEGRLFTAAELLAHARVDPALAEAIAGAFLEGSFEVGNWLRDHRGEGDGIRIERIGRRWRAVYTSDTSRAVRAGSVD